jgi:hypothetical protein
MPHLQRWPAHWSASGAQTWQAALPEPHAVRSVPATQALPLQQPAHPEVASQTQAPPLQRRPAPQGGPLPHWQAPEAEQPSAVLPQSMQAPPRGPQAAPVRAVQTFPEQQPEVQVDALHWQTPETQADPMEQAAKTPQRQAPLLQTLARVVSQTWHWAPLAPQAESAVPSGTQVVPEQQPVGQEVALQTQAPPEQTCPLPQAGPPPQVQAPVAAQPSATSPQSWQVVPGALQAWTPSGVQVFPKQQPSAHDVESQVQPAAVQRWPAAQAGPPRQVQEPLVQPSARSASQAWQAAPGIPQAARRGGSQPVAEQQPPGQDAASQAQPATVQCRPSPHGGPPLLLQPQSPEARQASDRASHATQASPPIPHWLIDKLAQPVEVQQPRGQEVELQAHVPPEQLVPTWHFVPEPQLHTPAVQRSAKSSQGAQAAPLVPHLEVVFPSSQTSPEQQPGQEVASQTHPDGVQRWPFWQAVPLPHLQAPSVQRSARSGSQTWQAVAGSPQAARFGCFTHAEPAQQPVGQDVALQTHWPPSQRRSSWQALPAPQRHRPSSPQESAPAPQSAQVPPAVPQDAADVGVWHSPPWQQPSGQESASQTQEPRSQRLPEGQIGPAPQLHSPALEQASPEPPVQSRQVPPFGPQAAALGVATQVEPWQQPSGQSQVSHLPATQKAPRQSEHWPPGKPQKVEPMAWQSPSLSAQQPSGHEAEVHRHKSSWHT